MRLHSVQAAANVGWNYDRLARPTDIEALVVLGLVAVLLAWLFRGRRR